MESQSMNCDYTEYKYVSLQDPNEEIRLLVLIDGTGDDDNYLAATILQGKLKDAPPFAALSYTWGTVPDSYQRLEIRGTGHFEGNSSPRIPISDSIWPQDIMITPNLFATLKRFRDLTQRHVIWADAVCIDQLNSSEKSHQVRHMDKIYKQARTVYISLETLPGNDTELVVELVTLLDGVVHGRYGSYANREKAFDGFIAHTRDWSQHWSALEDLISHHPWFTRRWVIQEVALSGHKMVICDAGLMCFCALRTASDLGVGVGHFKGIHDVEQLQKLDSLYHAFKGGRELTFGRNPQELSLDSLLSRFFKSLSTDPSDAVYSLLSLASDVGDDFPIDYNCSSVAVFLHAFKHIVKKSKTLDIMCHSNGCVYGGVPTWLPVFGHSTDFERNPHRPACSLHDYTEGSVATLDRPRWKSPRPVYSASKDTLPTFEVDEDLGNDMFKLLAKGYTVDIVQNSASQQWCLVTTEHLPREWLQLAASRSLQYPPQRTEGSPEVPDVFWRSLTGNRVSETGDPDAELSQLSKHWLNVLKTQYLSEVNDYAKITMRELARRFTPIHFLTCNERQHRFALTENSMGFIPSDGEAGDTVHILLGCSVPVVLKKCVGYDTHYHFVGACYIDGIMEGEFMDKAEREGLAIEEFDIR